MCSKRFKPALRSRASASPLLLLEDATAETIARIKKLGGGISVQDRLALTGERNMELWGVEKARNAPALRAMIDSGVPLGAGRTAFARRVIHRCYLWVVDHRKICGRFGNPQQEPESDARRSAASVYDRQRLADLR